MLILKEIYEISKRAAKFQQIIEEGLSAFDRFHKTGIDCHAGHFHLKKVAPEGCSTVIVHPNE